ncbi:MAG TPA: hypothetical protein VMY42_01730 [Thermoguttaceae bacterium]|nr:hypothetical protein [Thermoguttaceae bacterium]
MSRQFTKEEMDETAIHEAAHAVLFWHFDMGIEYTEIYVSKREDGRRGATSPKKKGPGSFCHDELKETVPCMEGIMVHLAGIAAHRVLRSKVPQTKSGSDWEKATTDAQALCYRPDDDEATLCRDWLLKRTENLIRGWDKLPKAIEALAKALLAKKPVDGVQRIEGSEATRIIEGVCYYSQDD